MSCEPAIDKDEVLKIIDHVINSNFIECKSFYSVYESIIKEIDFTPDLLISNKVLPIEASPNLERLYLVKSDMEYFYKRTIGVFNYKNIVIIWNSKLQKGILGVFNELYDRDRSKR